MKMVKHLDRRDLILAIWAAEFVRNLDGKAELTESPLVLHRLASRAADCADRTVEALRLLVEVEFRLAGSEELDRCFMTWEKFIAAIQSNALTDYDGFGELATDDHHVSNLRIEPSGALNYVRPSWATHVCWYNK